MILFVSAILILLAGVAGYFIFRRGYVVAIALVLSAALTVLSCVATVPTGHTGVVTTFGKVEDYTLDAGVHLVKPWQQVAIQGPLQFLMWYSRHTLNFPSRIFSGVKA